MRQSGITVLLHTLWHTLRKFIGVRGNILNKDLLFVFKGINGGCTRTRTVDPLIKSQLLYQLSYTPVQQFCWGRKHVRRRMVYQT